MVSAGKREVVGEKDQRLAGFGILEANAAQWRREALARVEAGEHDRLVADQPRGAVDRMRVATLNLEIGLGAGDEEAAGLMKAVQPLEVEDSRDP